MSIKTLALITGGTNEERDISLKSAAYINQHIDKSKYTVHIIDMQGPDWSCAAGRIDKNDFTLVTDESIVKFDGVILMIHGNPAEDGRLQGYFEILDIPYTGCNTFSSALTFHKEATKNYLRQYDIPMAKSVMCRKGIAFDKNKALALGFPLFVKPNKYGSSVGISRVDEASQLDAAIEEAFKYDDDVMIEAFLSGSEISSGVIYFEGEIIAFPLTEIIPHNVFFDYEAKYLGASDEITPARISDALTEKCQERSKQIYQLLYCNGVVRVDYILEDGEFYMLEINTIPGLSVASLVPQQARAMGWSDAQLVHAIVESAFNK